MVYPCEELVLRIDGKLLFLSQSFNFLINDGWKSIRMRSAALKNLINLIIIDLSRENCGLQGMKRLLHGEAYDFRLPLQEDQCPKGWIPSRQSLQHDSSKGLSLAIRFLRFRRGDYPDPVAPETEGLLSIGDFALNLIRFVL
jgi:hypothetical protein